jgi:hypothetical protein
LDFQGIGKSTAMEWRVHAALPLRKVLNSHYRFPHVVDVPEGKTEEVRASIFRRFSCG